MQLSTSVLHIDLQKLSEPDILEILVLDMLMNDSTEYVLRLEFLKDGNCRVIHHLGENGFRPKKKKIKKKVLQNSKRKTSKKHVDFICS